MGVWDLLAGAQGIFAHELEVSPGEMIDTVARPNVYFQRSQAGRFIAWSDNHGAAEKRISYKLNIGDGSTMDSASGFWTMARYEIPVLTIVPNNHSYDSMPKSYVGYNGRMKAANKFAGTVLDNPLIDFVSLAKSHGCQGIRVRK